MHQNTGNVLSLCAGIAAAHHSEVWVLIRPIYVVRLERVVESLSCPCSADGLLRLEDDQACSRMQLEVCLGDS